MVFKWLVAAAVIIAVTPVVGIIHHHGTFFRFLTALVQLAFGMQRSVVSLLIPMGPKEGSLGKLYRQQHVFNNSVEEKGCMA